MSFPRRLPSAGRKIDYAYRQVLDSLCILSQCVGFLLIIIITVSFRTKVVGGALAYTVGKFH